MNLTLAVKAVPGTDAGFIISTMSETSDLLTEPSYLSDGTPALAVSTALDRAIAQARALGWQPQSDPLPVKRLGSDETVYLTIMRRVRDD